MTTIQLIKGVDGNSNNAFKGATTDALIGCRFGPVGLIAGTAIGGTIGFLIDD